jgi:hypothetical protein
MSDKRYKWDSPYEWLTERAREWDAGRLYHLLMSLAALLDTETLEDVFRSALEADGYFLSEEEAEEAAGPQDGDWVTEDHRTFYEQGSRRTKPVTVGEDEDWRTVLRARMDKEQFWPNVWFVSDHGNAHLLNISEED